MAPGAGPPLPAAVRGPTLRALAPTCWRFMQAPLHGTGAGDGVRVPHTPPTRGRWIVRGEVGGSRPGSRSPTRHSSTDLSDVFGAWGPKTWGKSPAEEAAELRRREHAEPPPGLLSWFGLHPWVWLLSVVGAAFVVLGPWLHVLVPSGVGTRAFLCAMSRTGTLATFTAVPNGSVKPHGLARGQAVTLLLNRFGEVVAVEPNTGSGPIPASAVSGLVDRSTTRTITITEVEQALPQCEDRGGAASSSSRGSAP